MHLEIHKDKEQTAYNYKFSQDDFKFMLINNGYISYEKAFEIMDEHDYQVYIYKILILLKILLAFCQNTRNSREDWNNHLFYFDSYLHLII